MTRSNIGTLMLLGLFDNTGSSSHKGIKSKPFQYRKCPKCESWMNSEIHPLNGCEYNICERCGVLIREGDEEMKDINNVKYISRWFWRL